MLKRIFDVCGASIGLVLTSPILVLAMISIWLQDFDSPFYIAPRVGKNGRLFKMFKLRSMVVNADCSGVASTAQNDRRVTRIGRLVRKFKLDELIQLWNVITGDMSLVGPRPNVKSETDLYSNVEKRLLIVRPGITDFASIIFADEGEILKGSPDPDLRYNQVIRPWKSRLGLLYIDKRSLFLDLRIVVLTLIVIMSRRRALQGIQRILLKLGADEKLLKMASRQVPLEAYPPPGMTDVVAER